MAKNKGNQFEAVVKECLDKADGVSIDRLRDAPRRMKGVDNPSDFIVYKKPHELYLECKSHKGNTLPFSCIRDEQYKGMQEKAKIEGVLAGVMIWYIDHDATVFVPIDEVVRIREEEEAKSINYFQILNRKHIIVHGRKKRTYFDYDMNRFLEDLFNEHL